MEKMPYQEVMDKTMESMPYRDALVDSQVSRQLVEQGINVEPVLNSDWRRGLPVLTGKTVRLRDLRASDAASLFALLTTEDVSRFISPPPASVEGFERFIVWATRQREAGAYACFAVTVEGFDSAIGILQVR